VDEAELNGVRRRAILLATVSTALLSAVPALAVRGARGCPNAGRRATAAPIAAMRTAVLCLVNRQRTAHHLPPLHANVLLDRSAQKWTGHMVATRAFSHGSDFPARISATGYRWSAAGENIATGLPTPSDVVAAWMRSPEHCRNILAPIYRDLGVGAVPRPVRGWASGPATWTQDFALAIGQRAPSHNWAPANGCPYRG
jgi:uncharacterized protein YkwD